jgi:5-carboxymethyl-2-hydroxymuconate isomerase
VYVPEEATYDDFVRVSKEIMKGRNTDQQREVVAKVLESLMPEHVPGVFR